MATAREGMWVAFSARVGTAVETTSERRCPFRSVAEVLLATTREIRSGAEPLPSHKTLEPDTTLR